MWYCHLGYIMYTMPDNFSCRHERIEGFSYDLDMKTRKQNRKKKRTEVERFDWFIERIQTRVGFGWLRERSGEKT